MLLVAIDNHVHVVKSTFASVSIPYRDRCPCNLDIHHHTSNEPTIIQQVEMVATLADERCTLYVQSSLLQTRIPSCVTNNLFILLRYSFWTKSRSSINQSIACTVMSEQCSIKIIFGQSKYDRSRLSHIILDVTRWCDSFVRTSLKHRYKDEARPNSKPYGQVKPSQLRLCQPSTTNLQIGIL